MTRPRSDMLADRQAGLAQALTAASPLWPQELLDAVRPGGTLDAAGALDVYRSGYTARLTEQLGETFATVWRVLGDDDFFALAARYIAGHLSASYNLSDYGRELPAFLERDAACRDASFLPELALLELAFHDLFHEAPHCPVEPSALAAIGDLNGVRLQIGSAVRLLAFGHAVHELFRHRNDEAAPDLAIDRPQWLLLYKHGDEVMAREIDEATFAALDALAGGATVDVALEAAVERSAAFGTAEVTSLFEIIGRCGLVTGWQR